MAPLNAVVIFLTFFIIFCLIWACICSNMAKKRGRNTRKGFVLGFFFGILAVIGYLLAGDSEELRLEKLRNIIKNESTKDN